uniref:Pentatricopeptide repeat-containing protein At1g68930 family n=1 Tax=Cajanus cajan TaxID=3821 RepID=A0A151QSK1_CAJCA|nr:Putative pentatricopeptide repeat-containing protein At1g68930 family [Cajanus cajan]
MSLSNHYCALLKHCCETKKVHCRIIKAFRNPETFLLNNLVNAYAKLGSITYARRVFDQMPQPNLYSWNTLLSSYSKLGRLPEMERVFDAMPTRDVVSWNSLISGYAGCGFLVQSVKAYNLMLNDGSFNLNRIALSKNQFYHGLLRCLISNPYSDQIYLELEKLNYKMVQEGYVPDMNFVLHDVEDSEKIKMLNHHSEKLAIAFGLIFIPPGLPIRVVKNLRVCGDCHNATKYISKITQREILVRDTARFHLFKDEICSCGDFW